MGVMRLRGTNAIPHAMELSDCIDVHLLSERVQATFHTLTSHKGRPVFVLLALVGFDRTFNVFDRHLGDVHRAAKLLPKLLNVRGVFQTTL